MNPNIIIQFFPNAIENIEKRLCPLCTKPVGEFKDRLSLKEYKISGMCQSCQDKTFGG